MWQRVAVRQGRLYARRGQELAKHVLPAVMKPARALWNQFIGFLFCCLALMFGVKTAQLAMEYSKAEVAQQFEKFIILLITGFCTGLMAWFGVGSFLRARKISRS